MNTRFSRMRVVLMCHVRYRTADLIHIVSIPQLIDFSVDNFVYIMIPNSSFMFLFWWSLLGSYYLE